MKTFKQSIISIVVGLAMVAGISWAANWTGPSANPPGANKDAPIHVGSETQTKTGAMNFNGVAQFNASIPLIITPGAGNGKVLTSDRNGNASWQSEQHGKQRFTSNGTFTVPAGVTKVWVSMSGGGGSGGGGGRVNAGGGGGGGSVIAQEVAVTPNQSIPVTVGTGGLGVSPKFNGLDGTASVFGSITASGGKGGKAGTDADNGYGGMGGTVSGATGVIGGRGGDRGGRNSGAGGSSIFGGGGPATDGSTESIFRRGYDGSGYGGGGGGGGGDETDVNKRGAGGGGSPGFVLVEW